MKMSKTVEMAQELVSDTLLLVRSDRGDAAEAGFNPDVYKSVVSGMLEKNLQHLQRLIEGISEDAQLYEERLRKIKAPDEDGHDADTGKPIGRIWPVAEN